MWIIVALATLTLSFGGQHTASAVEREIHAMEQQWNDARAKADVATLDRIIARGRFLTSDF